MPLPGPERTIACRFTRGPDGRSKHSGDIREPDDRFGAPWAIGDGWYWWVEKHRFAVICIPPHSLGAMVRSFDRKLWDDDDECLAEVARVQMVIRVLDAMLTLVRMALPPTG